MPPEELAKNPWLIAAGWLILLALAGSLIAWAWALGRLWRDQPLLDEGRPRIVPWGLGSVASVAILYLLLNFTVSGLYSASRSKPEAPPVPAAAKAETIAIPPNDQLMIMVVINLLVVVLVPPLLVWTSGARFSELGLIGSRSFGRDLARGAVTCLMLGPLVYGIYLAAQQIWKPTAHPVQEALTQEASGISTLLIVFSAVVAAPLAEELLFRGVLLGWLTRVVRLLEGSTPQETRMSFGMPGGTNDSTALPRFAEFPAGAEIEPSSMSEPPRSPTKGDRQANLGPGAWAVNLSVAILFAGMHAAQWPAPVPLFLLSVGLGWLYQRTGRLVAPVALHATFNGFSTLMLLLVSASGVELPEPAPAPAGAGVAGNHACKPALRKSQEPTFVNLTACGGALLFGGGPPSAPSFEGVQTGSRMETGISGRSKWSKGRGSSRPLTQDQRCGADHGRAGRNIPLRPSSASLRRISERFEGSRTGQSRTLPDRTPGRHAWRYAPA